MSTQEKKQSRVLGVLRALVKTARPKHWVKNVLVFAAPIAAGTITQSATLLHAVLAFITFCFVASATYLLNDALDAPADRLHPTKRERPIARGDLGEPLAFVLAACFYALGIAVATTTHRLAFVAVTACYVVINLAYCLRLKRVPVIELGCVASGFILRAAGGGVATSVTLSQWFLAVVSFGSLFLVVGKRLSEYLKLGGDTPTRGVLAEYSERFLSSAATLAATATVTAYCLWSFDRAHSSHLPLAVLLTTVPVVLAILHVLRLIDAGKVASPEDLVYSDRLVQGLVVGFALLFALGRYG